MDNFFDAFWAAWPAGHPRKGQKAECRRRWIERGLDLEGEHIVAHVLWLQTTDAWTDAGGRYIPAPLVYLNQARWDGAEIPESAEQAAVRVAALEERQIRQSIEAAGMQPRPTVRRVA